jgi:hypothetical protein
MTDLALRRLDPVLDLGQQLRLDPDRLVCDPLRIRLGLAHQRRQLLAQLRRRGLVKPVINLPGVDQVLALAAADIDAVPLAAVEREPGDGQGLSCAQVFLTQSLPRPEL